MGMSQTVRSFRPSTGTLFLGGEEPQGTQAEALADTEPLEGEFNSMPYVRFIWPNAETPSPMSVPDIPAPIVPAATAPKETPLPSGSSLSDILDASSRTGNGQSPVSLLLAAALAASVLLNLILATLLLRKRKR